MSKRETPHEAVSERFMRHHYGASGFVKKGSKMETEETASKIKELANSSLNDESRLQVLIHLTAQLAEEVARLRNQLNL